MDVARWWNHDPSAEAVEADFGPTIDGEETLKIPAGTQPGKVFHLRGKGVPRLRGSGRGDHNRGLGSAKVAARLPNRRLKKLPPDSIE